MSVAIRQDWRQRAYGWLYEHLEGFSWMALFMFASLLVVMIAGLLVASRSRSTVTLENRSGRSIHDVKLRPAAASSREPRHFVPHIEPGKTETFVVYPLQPGPVFLDYLGQDGAPHHWQGAVVGPKTGEVTLRVDAEYDVRVIPARPKRRD